MHWGHLLGFSFSKCDFTCSSKLAVLTIFPHVGHVSFRAWIFMWRSRNFLVGRVFAHSWQERLPSLFSCDSMCFFKIGSFTSFPHSWHIVDPWHFTFFTCLAYFFAERKDLLQRLQEFTFLVSSFLLCLPLFKLFSLGSLLRVAKTVDKKASSTTNDLWDRRFCTQCLYFAARDNLFLIAMFSGRYLLSQVRP